MDSRIRMSTVTVKKLPETLGLKRRRNFFREIGDCMNVDRPGGQASPGLGIRMRIDSATLLLRQPSAGDGGERAVRRKLQPSVPAGWFHRLTKQKKA